MKKWVLGLLFLILFSFSFITAYSFENDTNSTTNLTDFVFIETIELDTNVSNETISQEPLIRVFIERPKVSVQPSQLRSRSVQSLQVEEQPSFVGDVQYDFDDYGFYVSEVTAEEYQSLIDSGVSISPDLPIRAFLQDSVGLVNATGSWNLSISGSNLTGAGQTVCVIDTGVNYSHADLGGCLGAGCKVLGGYDFVNNDSDPIDDAGHGTHVAGIVAANGTLRGVAPDANIVAVKILNASGDGSFSDLVAGIDWCTNNAETYNITIISMSLGTSLLYTSHCDNVTSPINYSLTGASINAAVAKNITLIAASGNDNSNTGIPSPACFSTVVPITATTKAGAVASYGNVNSLVKLAATGSSINSTSYLGGYESRSGTSMATPHAAGAFAILKQFALIANLSNTTTQYVNSFIQTGTNVTRSSNTVSLMSIGSTIRYVAPAPSFSSVSVNKSVSKSGVVIAVNTSVFDLFNVTQVNSSTGNFTFNGTDWNGTIVAGTNYISARDENGKVTTRSVTEVTVDNLAPFTTLLANGASIASSTSSWYNASVNITFLVNDSNSYTTQYRFVPNQTWIAGSSFVLNETRTVQFRSVDVAGNIELFKQKKIQLDLDNPQILYVSENQSLVPNTLVTFSAYALDALSGIANQTLAIYNSSLTISDSYTNNSIITLVTNVSAGNYTVNYTVFDNAGNSAFYTRTITVVERPILSLSTLSGSIVANLTTINFVLNQTSDVNYSYLDSFVSFTNISNLSVILNNSGTITVNTTSPAGLFSDNFTYTVDATAPTISLSSSQSSPVNGTIIVGVLATDANLKNITFVINNQTTYYNQSVNVTIDSFRYLSGMNISATAYDIVGKTATTTLSLNVSKPVITVSFADRVADFSETVIGTYLQKINGVNDSVNASVDLLSNRSILSNTSVKDQLLLLSINSSTDSNATLFFSIPTDDVDNTSLLRIYENHTGSYEGPYNITPYDTVDSYYRFNHTVYNFSDFLLTEEYPSCTVGSAISSSCLCGGTQQTSGYCCSTGWSSSSCSSSSSSSSSSGGGGGGSGGGYAFPTVTVANTSNTTLNKTVNTTKEAEKPLPSKIVTNNSNAIVFSNTTINETDVEKIVPNEQSLSFKWSLIYGGLISLGLIIFLIFKFISF